jgi:two-component system, chemotaxis family, protein-glutamate methylesterase/glutaminase
VIEVFVVDDSPVAREFLVYLLDSDPGIRVIGTVTNGKQAIEALKEKKPDVITMDIHMPEMDGFEATRRIMETSPTPIVIVTAAENPREVGTSFRAIEAGALAVVPRPQGLGHPEFESNASELIRTVKLMSEIKVVRRWNRARTAPSAPALRELDVNGAARDIQVVAIGASTGGPIALQTILSQLPRDFAVPALIVQHMAPGFTRGFVDWLNHDASVPVHLATQGEALLAGHVYVAPDGFQMGVKVTGRIALSHDAPEYGLRPSVSFLFRSLAELYGERSVGVLLTGMGKDGAAELQSMKQHGAITFAQDEESSVVHGMPGEAIRLEAATYVLPPNKIGAALQSLVKKAQPQPRLEH